MDEVREWPKPFKDLIVEFEDGEKCYALYTGDGWMFNLTLLSGFKREKVERYSYVNPSDDE